MIGHLGQRVVYVGSDEVSHSEGIKGNIVGESKNGGTVVDWDKPSSNAYLYTGGQSMVDRALRIIDVTHKKGKVMGIASKIKELALSSDERLLRRVGLKDSDGDWTSEATVVLVDMLLEERKADIITKAKEVEAEEKKAKKEGK